MYTDILTVHPLSFPCYHVLGPCAEVCTGKMVTGHRFGSDTGCSIFGQK